MSCIRMMPPLFWWSCSMMKPTMSWRSELVTYWNVAGAHGRTQARDRAIQVGAIAGYSLGPATRVAGDCATCATAGYRRQMILGDAVVHDATGAPYVLSRA